MTTEPLRDVEVVADALRAWDDRDQGPECLAAVQHGPGHQSKTHCQNRYPHTVHAASYGSYGAFGVWIDKPEQVDPRYPWIEAGTAFDPDDSDDDLMRRYEQEQWRAVEQERHDRAAFIAARLASREEGSPK